MCARSPPSLVASCQCERVRISRVPPIADDHQSKVGQRRLKAGIEWHRKSRAAWAGPPDVIQPRICRTLLVPAIAIASINSLLSIPPACQLPIVAPSSLQGQAFQLVFRSETVFLWHLVLLER